MEVEILKMFPAVPVAMYWLSRTLPFTAMVEVPEREMPVPAIR